MRKETEEYLKVVLKIWGVIGALVLGFFIAHLIIYGLIALDWVGRKVYCWINYEDCLKKEYLAVEAYQPPTEAEVLEDMFELELREKGYVEDYKFIYENETHICSQPVCLMFSIGQWCRCEEWVEK